MSAKVVVRPKEVSDQTLDPDFVALASAALTLEGCSGDFNWELENALRTLGHIDLMRLIKNAVDLADVATKYSDKFDAEAVDDSIDDLLKHAPKTDDEALSTVYVIRNHGIWSGLFVGLVAGHLLTKLQAGDSR